ncbi:MAG TPA: TolC family protein [Labilithrix sp.]|nr:TolC family protein [Labilithrix sp.]
MRNRLLGPLTASVAIVLVALEGPSFAQAPPGGAPGAAPNAPPPPPSAGAPLGPAPPLPKTPRFDPGLNPVRPGQTSNLPGTGTSGGGPPPPQGKRPPQGTATQPAPIPLPDVARVGVNDMTAVTPGGLTAEKVGERSAATSYQAKAAEELVTGANARADQQWASYIPRLGLTGRYTRLSNFTPPSLGDTSTVETTAAAGTINPTPTVAVAASRFPNVLDQFLLQATIAVPITDYLLRIGKAYTAATESAEAARFDVIAARAKSYADGKIAYFTWLRARGAAVVADQSLAVARAHLADTEKQFAVGNTSKADVLRAQTQVAASELSIERAKSGVVITERQVRLAIHAPEEETLAPAESLEAALPPQNAQLKALVAEATSQRAELKSITKNADAARRLAEVARAGKIPTVSGFGDLTYANPNARVFPQRSVFTPTWSVGAQVTWSPNDFLVAGGGGNDAESRAAALDAQKVTVRDAVELEVTQAYQSVIEADAAIGTTQRQLDSAVEGYRVARELFSSGRATSTTLIDAEIVLAQSRFDHLNALVDARLGRIRLDYAVGRSPGAVAAR